MKLFPIRCGAAKCHQLHIGAKNQFCPELTVNKNDKVEKVTKDKYLGSIISDSNNNK